MSVVTDRSDLDFDTSGTASPTSSKSAQWKFKSKYLDMELEADEALRLQMELQHAIRASKKKAKVKVPTRLLQPTASFKQSEYQKPSPKSIDVREVGWNTRDKNNQSQTSSKPTEPSPAEPETSPTVRKAKKVRQTSSRLLEVSDNHKYKPPVTPEIAVAETLKKLSYVKPIDPNTHLLKPKKPPKIVTDVKENDDIVSIHSARSGIPNTTTQSFLMKSPRFGKDEVIKVKIPKSISPDSHLLQRSTRTRNASNDNTYESSTNNSESEVTKARKLSMKTGPKDVESRLMQLTASVKAAAWTGPKGPSEEELAEMRWQEEQAKKEPIMVFKPSERLLLPTAANEYAAYKKPDERDEIQSTIHGDDGSKVVEISPRLLQLTTAAESHVYKGPTAFPTWTSKDNLDTPIKIGGRLLEGTTSYEKSKYQKQEADIDPRELGWKFYGPKKEEQETTEEDESNTTSEVPVMKVRETSERVLSLTAAYQARLKSAEEAAASPTNHQPKPVSANEHFLKPTASFRIASSITAMLRGDEEESDHSSSRDQSPKPMKPIPASLLAPTASFENRLKGSTASDIESVDTTHSPTVVRSVTSSERFLSPTASFVNRLATVDETKPLANVPLSTTVKPVMSNARFLEQTASSASRKLSVVRQDSIGNMWIDAISSTSSTDRRSASPSIASVYSKSTISSVSVKSLVSALESSRGFGKNPIRIPVQKS